MVKKCDVRICDLRHSVEIQAENATVDAGGGLGDPWAIPTVIATVRMCIEPLRGSERVRAMQLESPVSHKMTMRYRSDVTARNRLLFDSRLFNIRSAIDPDERKRWLEIMADEGVAM